MVALLALGASRTLYIAYYAFDVCGVLKHSRSFAASGFLSTVCTFGTGFVPNPRTTIGVYAAILVSQGTIPDSRMRKVLIRRLAYTKYAGLINTFGVRFLRPLNNVSVGWHALGTTALVIAVLAAAPKHQSATFVFTTFIDNTGAAGVPGWSQRASVAYVVVVSGACAVVCYIRGSYIDE